MSESPIRLVIVDDAVVVRGMISRLLRDEADIEVISTASDGKIALDHARNLQPDVMILDIEMPNMDGITALPLILDASPHTKVIIASTLTERNAAISLQALALGASDYLKKPETGDDAQQQRFSRELLNRIRALGQTTPVPASGALDSMLRYPGHPPKALAIAASTGGPQALTTIFQGLGNGLSDVPIFITQHMPSTFTPLLAQNLNSINPRPCSEAIHDDVVKAGATYLAPGDRHLTCVKEGREIVIQLDNSPPVNFCRPAADPMILSLIEIYGAELMLLVLTGMGQDGLAGATILSQAQGAVITQDKASSVVWGMPKAVSDAGLSIASLSLNDIAPYLIKSFGG